MPPKPPDMPPAPRSRRGFLASLAALAGGGLAAISAPRVLASPAAIEGSGLPYIGEIRMVAFHFAPVGWLGCNGQLVPIAQYEALFFLIGTTFGGDGQTTFAIPDLRGRLPVHAGLGYVLGQMGGATSVSLSTAQLPAHAHGLFGDAGSATAAGPAGGLPARDPAAIPRFGGGGAPAAMSAGALAAAGGGQPHNNMPPYLAVHFIIATEGIFPSPA